MELDVAWDRIKVDYPKISDEVEFLLRDERKMIVLLYCRGTWEDKTKRNIVPLQQRACILGRSQKLRQYEMFGVR